VERAREKHELSERHACRLVNQWRGTQRYLPIQRVDEDALTRAIITLAIQMARMAAGWPRRGASSVLDTMRNAKSGSIPFP
jgi:hypothetical protein